MSMDLILQGWVSGIIEVTRLQWMLGPGTRWAPGRKLRLLFTGYNGTRNTGADVRVEEMLRQVRHILGEGQTELSVLTQDFDLTRGYFKGTRQIKLPDIFPPFLYREVRRHDGVVACEGSMFKSKFANALTTMMVGSLAIASSQNRLAVGYGAEAGDMDALLTRMVRRYCRESFVITRNPESSTLLAKLGVATEIGTDTAWTFEPHPLEYGRRILLESGWDGSSPVLVVCPINPFWWPVKASVTKWVARAVSGAFRDSHYRSVYFHRSGNEVTRKYERYLAAITHAVETFKREERVFPVLVAMEALDARACREISARLNGAPVFTSLDYDMFELVSILRSCHVMLSSRYHGIVTSMPALLPSAGVTMDERIRNLMHERGHEHLLMTVDDSDLEERIVASLRALVSEREAIRDAIGRTVARNLKVMARMGVFFEEHLARRYPEFPIRTGVHNWEDYLPPLSPTLQNLLETHEPAVPLNMKQEGNQVQISS